MAQQTMIQTRNAMTTPREPIKTKYTVSLSVCSDPALAICAPLSAEVTLVEHPPKSGNKTNLREAGFYEILHVLSFLDDFEVVFQFQCIMVMLLS